MSFRGANKKWADGSFCRIKNAFQKMLSMCFKIHYWTGRKVMLLFYVCLKESHTFDAWGKAEAHNVSVMFTSTWACSCSSHSHCTAVTGHKWVSFASNGSACCSGAAAVLCAPALMLLTVPWCLCGMLHSASPGWVLAWQQKKGSRQATVGLITGPDWGHHWKLWATNRGHSRMVAVCAWFYFLHFLTSVVS